LATSELPGALVADANVVLSAVNGGRASMVFGDVHAPPIHAADAVRNEILEWLPKLAAKRGLDLGPRLALFQLLPVTWVPEGDWPTVALALVLSESRSVSVWTNDKDFSAAGVDTVTTGALLDEVRRTSRRF